MTRRSKKIALYNNTNKQQQQKSATVSKRVYIEADATSKAEVFYVYDSKLLKAVAVLVCASMCLQPFFAQANETAEDFNVNVDQPESTILPENASVDSAVAEEESGLDVFDTDAQKPVVESLDETAHDASDNEVTQETAPESIIDTDEAVEYFDESLHGSTDSSTDDTDANSLNEAEGDSIVVLEEISDGLDLTGTSTETSLSQEQEATSTEAVPQQNFVEELSANSSATTTDSQDGVAQNVAGTSTQSVSDAVSTTTVSASESTLGSTNTNEAGESDVPNSGDVSDSSSTSASEQVDSVSDSSDASDLATTTDSEQATTTEQSDPTVIAVVESNSEFAFTEDECTVVEDGSYYCQKSGTQPVSQADDLVAAPDADGDLEIYLRQKGEERKLTDNLVDDASPFYDVRSNTIVWHRLLNDRYQIVSYDVETKQEEVLTDTRVNNMQPTRSGDITVWQRWVDDNWEIVMFENGTEKQLTDSAQHDIAPSIRGDLVIWNVRTNDGTQSLRTYDISSGVYNDIADEEGVAVSNPRMVVVYDVVYENGDTVMKGFDLVTGELIPLQQIPGELPEELPEPDSTGETRALVSPAPPKPEQDSMSEDLESDPFNEDPDESILNLQTTASSSATSTAEAFIEYELNLRRNATSTESEAVNEIEDLVIEPLSTTTSTSTQS